MQERYTHRNYRNFGTDATDYLKLVYEINDAGLTEKITCTDHENDTPTGTKREEYTLTYDKRGYITGETAYTNYTTANTGLPVHWESLTPSVCPTKLDMA